MIYCKIKENKKDQAIYHVGTDTDNMTGVVVFYKDKAPMVEKQPEGGQLPVKLLANIFVKYKNDFAKGDFKEKLSYEIG